ncbi:DNA polymerase III subunit beta [Bosea sp. LC85]|uniref:DNA polymerase III subunit beta n=1 Tax=Bosea sp. LC85 TaxID=1502851 RepID=UPI0004E43CFE|nr:DNA polymerase III subunit beta [Bosea sp. LC85]KFC64010.1 DNA polymerase III subunit beta [Bosea sp. LC85]
MKLTIARAALLKALEPAQRIVERRNTIPVLSNLRLVASDDTLTVTGTDLDIELRIPAPAEVATPGALTVSAARIYEIVRKLPDEAKVSIEAKDETSLSLTSGRSRFTLQTLPDSDFPDITTGEMSHRFDMPAAALAGLIAATQFAISTEETLYYLNGIFLHQREHDGAQTLTAVATDGHRLARIHCPLPADAAGMPNVIVPRKAVAEIARLLDKAKQDVTVELSVTKIRVTIEGMVLTSKLIDGTYPDYQRVIPMGNYKRATAEAKTLADAADRVATISGERGRAVKLAFGDGRVVLSVTNPDSGSATEEVDCEYEASPIEIGFNARYLSEVLGVLGGDTVLIRLADPGSPTILQTREGADLLIVLMPMRV